MGRQLPNRILELRKARGLSEDALADLLRWQKSKVHRLENGATVLGLDDMRAIAGVLGLKPTELLNDEDVEYRAGEAEEIVRGALAQISVDDREMFVRACLDITRVARRLAPGKAVMLAGSPMQTMQLAELWNDLDERGRHNALCVLRGMADRATTPPLRQAAE